MNKSVIIRFDDTSDNLRENSSNNIERNNRREGKIHYLYINKGKVQHIYIYIYMSRKEKSNIYIYISEKENSMTYALPIYTMELQFYALYSFIYVLIQVETALQNIMLKSS
jgi:hypothetical protein